MKKDTQKLEFTQSISTLTKYVNQLDNPGIWQIIAQDNLFDVTTPIYNLANGYTVTFPFQDVQLSLVGGTCSTFVDSGTMSALPITLQGIQAKYNLALCLDDLRAYFYGAYAGQDLMDNTIPFEGQFLDQFYKRVSKDINQKMWRGGSLGNSGSLTGFLALAVTAGATTLATQSFAVSTGSTASGILATFDNMVNQLDADTLMADDLTIYVGTQEILAYAQSIRNLNNFWLDPNKISLEGTYLYSHPKVFIVPQSGLSGAQKALLTRKAYVFSGTDKNPNDKQIKVYEDFLSDKTLYALKFPLGNAIAPAGSGKIVVAAANSTFA